MNFLQKARDNHFNKCLLNNNVIYIFTKKYIQYFTKYNNLGTVFLINTVLLIIVNNIIPHWRDSLSLVLISNMGTLTITVLYMVLKEYQFG